MKNQSKLKKQIYEEQVAGLATQEAGSNLFTGSTKQEYVDDPYAKIQVPQGPEQVSTPSLLEQIRAEILFEQRDTQTPSKSCNMQKGC